MEEIGLKLKEAREKMGVSIEEVAEDLKVKPSQIENVEAGNKEAFEDVFYLKYFIRDYAKYLGLNKEDLVDEFNEFLFDYTSRISLDDIKVAKAKSDKKKSNKIKSPYTTKHKAKLTFIPFLIYTIIVILVVSIIYFVVSLNESDDGFDEGTVITENK